MYRLRTAVVVTRTNGKRLTTRFPLFCLLHEVVRRSQLRTKKQQQRVLCIERWFTARPARQSAAEHGI